MTADEHKKFIEENENVMICCGRMGPMCIPVYGAMEELENEYSNVKFADMEFDNPEAHIIRNAGGRASEDAIRSLILSHKLLYTDHWFVIHHTDCGMETIDNKTMGELLADNLDHAVLNRTGWENMNHGGGSDEGKTMDWLTISDRVQSLVDDVRRIREHPLVSENVSVYGFLYDVKTGRLEEIAG